MKNGTSKSTVGKLTEFYLEQAVQCSEAARTATLENVRERAVRSEAAWRGMAELSAARAESYSKDAIVKAAATEALHPPEPIA